MLRIEIVEVSKLHVRAIFDFKHDETNAHGRFYIEGDYDLQARQIVFKPKTWIAQPTDYLMIGMVGTVASVPTKIAGEITHAKCRSFEVDLQP